MPDINDIVAENADVVWRIVRRLLTNDDDAKDCYQQTFLDALRMNATTVRHWRPMLCQIATRRTMDQLRKRYRDRKAFSTHAVEAAEDLPPDQDLIHRELREEVRKVLATLPTKQAEAFWLRHIEQLTPNEIADCLDVEPGHVRVLVHRAAKCLRDALQPIYGITKSEGGGNDCG